MIEMRCDCGAKPELHTHRIGSPSHGSIAEAWDAYCPGCHKCIKIFLGSTGQITIMLIDPHERGPNGEHISHVQREQDQETDQCQEDEP